MNAPALPLWADLDDLRARQNWKWQKYPGDVLSAWVADMDVLPPPPVQAALSRMVSRGDYGYPMFEGDHAEREVEQCFAQRMQRLYGWTIDAADVVCVNNLVQSVYYALMAFSEKGDGVVVQMPSYPPFRAAIATLERKLLTNDFVDHGGGYVFDLAALERSARDARILILCNPHNPTGRVLTRTELEDIARIAVAHDLVVLSDEIHSDLVYDGRQHIPFATLGHDIAARTITLNSASKSFGMPGIRCAVMHFGTAELKARFHQRIPKLLLGHPSIMGIAATNAAWTEGDAWLAQLVSALQANRDYLLQRLDNDLPDIRVSAPQATYMAYLDCAGQGVDGSVGQHLLHHGLACSFGETFFDGHLQFVRFNFATSPAILDAMLDRLVGALK